MPGANGFHCLARRAGQPCYIAKGHHGTYLLKLVPVTSKVDVLRRVGLRNPRPFFFCVKLGDGMEENNDRCLLGPDYGHG